MATQDTVTQLRAAVRKLLRLTEGTGLDKKIRAALGALEGSRTISTVDPEARHGHKFTRVRPAWLPIWLPGSERPFSRRR